MNQNDIYKLKYYKYKNKYLELKNRYNQEGGAPEKLGTVAFFLMNSSLKLIIQYLVLIALFDYMINLIRN